MPTVSGVDLLTILPNQGAARLSSVDLEAERTQTATGIVLESTFAPPTTTHALTWGYATRSELSAIEALLDARKGRRVPLWVPTYQRDVVVLSSSSTTWVVTKRADGADLGSLVATEPHWQWWISHTSGGASYRVYHFTSVTDNLDGTETWTGTTPTGTAANTLTSAQYGVFSRLCFCRMAEDTYRVTHKGKASVVDATFVEVSAEAP
jgi:hypothetical protein